MTEQEVGIARMANLGLVDKESVEQQRSSNLQRALKRRNNLRSRKQVLTIAS